MDNGLPPLLPLGSDEEGKRLTRTPADASPFVHGTNQLDLPVLPIAFTTSDELGMHVESNSMKRPIQNGHESNMNNKQMKASHPHSDSEIPGWGPNRNAVNVPDGGGLLLQSLVPNQLAQNNGLTITHASNTHASSNANIFRGDELAFHQAGLTAVREQMNRNNAVNAALLANFYTPNGRHSINQADFAFLNATQNRQQQTHAALHHQLRNQLAGLTSLNQMNQGIYGIHASNSPFSSIGSTQDQVISTSNQLTSLLRQLHTANNAQPNNQSLSTMVAENVAQVTSEQSCDRPTHRMNQQNLTQRQSLISNGHSNLDLASCVEGTIQAYSDRHVFCLGISEDPNWLSEFHCFVRSELVEVYRASHNDVTARNNSIAYQQVGIRCRFCAHMPPSARSGRSSAFPSSLRQIYQSFTMMLRDHFANCEAIPSSALIEFNNLKDKPAQGATDSKRYWIYSAKKIGMIDTSDGIMMTQQSRYDGLHMTSFGTVGIHNWDDDVFRNDSLVRPGDRGYVPEFLYILMSQVQPIRLTETECIGNRRSLQVGLPGFGCRYCCDQKRFGLCRMFPARRRTLPHKVNDLCDHLRRCTLCPQAVKDSLEQSQSLMTISFRADQGSCREFYDRVWSRLGHSGVSASS